MPTDDAGPDDKLAEKITNVGDTPDWFPHISLGWQVALHHLLPDESSGPFVHWKWHEDQACAFKDGLGAKGAELTTVRTFFSGQGSGNTGGWSPDSKKFPWTEYETIPDRPK